MRFPMIRARRAPRIRARSAEGIMTGKNQEFRHPEAAAFLRSLTAAEAAKHPPLVREHDGVITQYWRDGGEVRCREVEAGEEPEMEALLAAVESEFGRSLPRLRAELRGDGVPDLDALETSIREKMLECGAKACKALLEAYGAELPAPPCADCGERMDQSARAVKGFLSRLGLIDLERIQFHCRSCRVGLHPLDRALDLVGRNATPGAESICADAASSDSYEAASRKLKNLAGVDVPKSTLQRCCMRIGQEVQAFEREDVEPEAPSADRVLVEIDGTGVPMVASEVEGVAGKQADGTAKTCEAKVIVRYRADSRDPVTGAPRKDKGSGAVSARIDSARAEGGAGRTSEFAGRLERFGLRNGVFEAKELAVLSDGAAWIRNVCEEILPGRRVTYVLDQFHALDCAAAAVQALAPDEGGRKARMEEIKQQLNDGQVACVIDGLKPHRDRDKAVASCIDYFEANKDRMRYDRCRERGLPVGSGVVESACKQIVGSRFKRAGCRWSKAGANALLAVKCCLEYNRWADFLDWRACRAAAA